MGDESVRTSPGRSRDRVPRQPRSTRAADPTAAANERPDPPTAQPSELATTQRLAHIGSWRFDVASGTTTWSEELFRIAGLQPTPGPMTPAELARLFGQLDPDARRARDARMANLLRDGTPFDTEAVVNRSDGAIRHVIHRGEPIRDATGAIVGARGTVADVTELWEARAELATERRELVEAQRLTRVGSWTLNLADGVAAWSDEMFRIYGIERADVPPAYEKVLPLFTPDSRERIDAAFKRAIETGVPWELALELVRPDGARRYLIGRGEPVRDPSGAVVAIRGTISDVTELRETQAALAASEERYRFVIENIADVTAHVANDGTPLWISHRLTDVLGWHPDEWVGRSIVQYVHPDDTPALRAFYAEIETGGTASTEVRVRTKSGSYRWIAATSRQFRGSDDMVAGRAVTFRDVTELRETQAALAASEARFRLLAEYASDVVIRGSNEGILEWVSSSVTGVLGWRPEDLVGRPFRAFVHPDDLAHISVAASRVMARETARFEVRIRGSVGEYTWFRIVLRPVVDASGAVTGRIAGWQDISAVVAAREVAAIDRARLRATLDSLIDPHLYLQSLRPTDLSKGERRRKGGTRSPTTIEDFVVLDANPAAHESLRAGSELLGMRLSLAWAGIGEHGWLARLAGVAETGVPIVADDVEWRDAAGHRRLDLRAVRVGSDVSLVWRDVTERFLGAERRREELEARTRRVARRADYLARIEHALRTNLSVVEGWAALLGDPETLADATTLAKGLEAIERNARTLSRQVQNFMTEAAQTARAELIEAVPTDAVPIIRAVVADYEELPGQAELRATTPERCVIDGEPTALDTVVRHLVENATKFAGPTGTVEVELRAGSARAELVVRDDGPGLPEDLDVFAAFTKEGESAGHGLGLHVVRTLVEAMGGGIAAGPRKDGARGAEFRVALRMAGRRREPAPERRRRAGCR